MSQPYDDANRTGWWSPESVHCERSAFVIFGAYCSTILPESHEVFGLIEFSSAVTKPVFHMSSAASAQLGAALGIDSTSWQRALGHDLIGSVAASNVLVGELRYCPDCLRLGWHSALFQHPVVRACPIHRKALRCGCAHCGASVSTSAASIGRNHLQCGTCQRRLVLGPSQLPMTAALQVPHTRFTVVREALAMNDTDSVVRSPFYWTLPPDAVAKSATEARFMAFHVAWPALPLDGIRTRREALHTFDLEIRALSQQQINATAWQALIDTFDKLATVLEDLGCMEDVPPELCSANVGGARLNREMSLATAAFWRTTVAFDVARFLSGAPQPSEARANIFGNALPDTIGALQAIIRAQVHSFFVLSLIESRRCAFTAQVNWNGNAVAHRYAPSWVFASSSESIQMRMRCRTDEGSIERLVRRYGRRRLLQVPLGIDLLAVASGSHGAGYGDSSFGEDPAG